MASHRVLLVDDSEALRVTTSALLEDAGYEVVEASSLAEARASIDGLLDAVILDVHLGDGLGTDLIPELRASHPTTALIVLSGTSAPSEVRGADDLIVKGIAAEEMLERIARAIARRRP